MHRVVSQLEHPVVDAQSERPDQVDLDAAAEVRADAVVLDVQRFEALAEVAASGREIELRVRIDYRVFKLGNDAVYSTGQRFTVGANLAF